MCGGVLYKYQGQEYKVYFPNPKAKLPVKKKGDKIEITLEPDEAYGQRNPEHIQSVPLKNLQFPEGIKKPAVGGLARARSERGWHNAIILKAGKFTADVTSIGDVRQDGAASTGQQFGGACWHFD